MPENPQEQMSSDTSIGEEEKASKNKVKTLDDLDLSKKKHKV
jgi:hypothetical protein